MDLPGIDRGAAIVLTGLPAAGKSTIANALLAKLLERDNRLVTVLDGDAVRRHLTPGLGFSREDRDRNVRRVGRIASVIVENKGIAICALIAPYDRTRKEIRALIEEARGGFFLVHVATPLAICEQRDPKGLYARARAGDLPQFTGVSDPYEVPSDAELVVDATGISPQEAARQIADRLELEGYLAVPLRTELVFRNRLTGSQRSVMP